MLLKILGAFLILLPFMGIAMLAIKLDGWKDGLKAFFFAILITALVIGLVIAGVFLLGSSQ